jgi:uncharacterized membrane protein HdeD (DUF308 family)
MERIVLAWLPRRAIVEAFFARSWKPLAVRGLVGLSFGAVALLWPAITLAALIVLFGAYALVDGALTLTAAARQRRQQRVVSLVLEGFVGVTAGLAAFLWTGATARNLVGLIALWAILTGVLEIAIAVRLRREMPGELLLGWAGGVSLLFGILTLVWPAVSAFVIVILLGCYAFSFGAATFAFALRLRRLTVQ